jgi:hypothetical protein
MSPFALSSAQDVSSLVVSRYHLRRGPPPQLIETDKVEEPALSHEGADADLMLLDADPEPRGEDGPNDLSG